METKKNFSGGIEKDVYVTGKALESMQGVYFDEDGKLYPVKSMKTKRKLKWKKQEFLPQQQLPFSGNTVPKHQWLFENFTILSPSTITINVYELYDGKEIYRFKTLKEAKEFAESLLNKE